MQFQAITPPGWQPGRGYQHAVVVEGARRLVFLAGQVGSHAGSSDRVLSDDIAAQFDQALLNLKTALEAAGGRPENLTSMHVYVTDVAAYRRSLKAIGAAWQRHCGLTFPTMTLIGVTALFTDGAMVELEGTAALE